MRYTFGYVLFQLPRLDPMVPEPGSTERLSVDHLTDVVDLRLVVAGFGRGWPAGLSGSSTVAVLVGPGRAFGRVRWRGRVVGGRWRRVVAGRRRPRASGRVGAV